jgi:hypothetical protein
MTDSAFELAALRALRTRDLAGPARAAVTAVLEQTGRRLVDVQDGSGRTVIVGWSEGFEPNPQDGVLTVRRLSPSPLITLAACLGLCWRDHSEPPHPGEPVSPDAVLAVTSALGAARSHTLGALRHELRHAGLIELCHGQVCIGPALAAWPPAQIDALRRFADTLPRADDA